MHQDEVVFFQTKHHFRLTFHFRRNNNLIQRNHYLIWKNLYTKQHFKFQTKHNSKIDARGGEAAAAARQPNRKAIAISKSSLESQRFAKLPQTRNKRFAEEKVTQSN
jgi:hypothetical protein